VCSAASTLRRGDGQLHPKPCSPIAILAISSLQFAVHHRVPKASNLEDTRLLLFLLIDGTGVITGEACRVLAGLRFPDMQYRSSPQVSPLSVVLQLALQKWGAGTCILATLSRLTSRPQRATPESRYIACRARHDRASYFV
jgi:hypothetical protein